MPTGATLTHPAQSGAGSQQKSVLVNPFTRAARQHLELFWDVSQQLGSTQVVLGPQDVVAYGFMRNIVLQIEATGGSGTATVAATQDAPFNVIQEIVLSDVNGQPIVGPINGYDLYLINLFGGYAHGSPDPKQDPSYSAVATGANASGNFTFLLRVPVEICARDGLGSLGNQNAASTFKLRVTLAPTSVVYSTAPTTAPTVRVRALLEAWTQPSGADALGNPNTLLPPAHGTTSFWSKQTVNINAGNQQPRTSRVGNYIRQLIFVLRDGTGNRTDANWPDPFTLFYDTRQLKAYTQKFWKSEMKRQGDLTGALDGARGVQTGVYVEGYNADFDGAYGLEMRDGWLWTSQGTRLDFQGSFGGAGTLSILTNDVATTSNIFI